MRQQFLVDTVETFQTYVYEHNRKIVPSSATLTVYKPGSDTEVVSAQAMTVAGDGLLSYSLSANDTADENYKAVIAYVYNAVTYTLTLFYDVVNAKLHKVVTDEDVVNELPQLKDFGYREHGTADSGSTTIIVDANLTRFADDHFTGGTAYSIDKDETRGITDFVSSIGTVTTSAFSSAISTDKYVLTRSYTREIQRAFEEIEERLRQKGRRPHLVLDPNDLREVHILMSVAQVCKGLVATEGEGSLWWEFMNLYNMKANSWWKHAIFKYDTSEDGNIVGAEEAVRMTRRAVRG